MTCGADTHKDGKRQKRRIKRKNPHSCEWGFLWSGIRGSNPLPQPWQGCALPDELIPQKNGDSDGTRTHDLRRDRAAF